MPGGLYCHRPLPHLYDPAKPPRAELEASHSFAPLSLHHAPLPPSNHTFILPISPPSTMPFRQPLRDRCNTLLRICTDRKPTSTKSKLRANLTSSAGNTPPSTNQILPRSGITSPPPLPGGSMDPLEDFIDHKSGPRQFIPYLYLSSPSSPATLPTGSWTHVIRILTPSEEHPVGSTGVTESADNGCGHILNMYVGSKSRTALPLGARHLLVARDFLALALPYYACAHPTESPDGDACESSYSPLDFDPLTGPPPSQKCRTDAVRVLLVGPPRAVLAVATTYIAYASGCSVAHVMRCVVDEAEDAESCAVLGADARMGLGEQEMRILERVVKKEL
ncbi:hypothetical protein C8R44DRAFT_973472 [Mycena epipterygia]|nr:hypothetical protein C8R44DRAFT_973472 [Mycena epipterygia]